MSLTTLSRSRDALEASESDLDDFVDGFEAGCHAKSEHRAVLGSPAYRLGHDHGVQQAAERRRRAAAPAGRSIRFLRFVLIGFAIGVLIIMGLVKAAKADTLADWRLLNEVCQGGSGAVSDRACAARNPMAAKLRAEGWFQGNHGVWVSPAHVAAFNRVVREYDAVARANTAMLDTVMQGMMVDLRAVVPDEAIFALWNGRAGELLANTPYAASLLMYGLPYLERRLSGRNDPRFQMVRMP